MSFLRSVWRRGQSVAKPFIKSVPFGGQFIASRIDMSPTARQRIEAPIYQAAANAVDVGRQIQEAIERERIVSAKASADAQAARERLERDEASRAKALLAPPTPVTGNPSSMTRDQMMLYGTIAAAALVLVLLSRR